MWPDECVCASSKFQRMSFLCSNDEQKKIVMKMHGFAIAFKFSCYILSVFFFIILHSDMMYGVVVSYVYWMNSNDKEQLKSQLFFVLMLSRTFTDFSLNYLYLLFDSLTVKLKIGNCTPKKLEIVRIHEKWIVKRLKFHTITGCHRNSFVAKSMQFSIWRAMMKWFIESSSFNKCRCQRKCNHNQQQNATENDCTCKSNGIASQ